MDELYFCNAVKTFLTLLKGGISVQSDCIEHHRIDVRIKGRRRALDSKFDKNLFFAGKN